MGRFKEREENVKSDIFQTFVELVKQVGATAERFDGSAGPTPIDQLRSDVLYLGLHLVCVALYTMRAQYFLITRVPGMQTVDQEVTIVQVDYAWSLSP